MAACFIKYITNQNLSKTKLKLYLQTKNANMSHRTMNLIEHFARSKDKCILTDSLFYDTIMYSGFSKELVCENAFFFLMVTSGKAKVYTRRTRDYTCHIGKNDLLVIPASMTATFQQLSEDYAMHCLVFTPPFFYSLPSSQFLYGKLCEFVTRYSFASIHLKNDAGTYFKKTFSLFRGYRTGELLHQEGIYGHLCNFFILNVGDVFFPPSKTPHPPYPTKAGYTTSSRSCCLSITAANTRYVFTRNACPSLAFTCRELSKKRRVRLYMDISQDYSTWKLKKCSPVQKTTSRK